MKRFQLLKFAVLTCAIALLPTVVSADPIGTGSLSFTNGGTLTGNFVYDPNLFDPNAPFNTAPFISWDLTTTAFGTTHRYVNTNTADGASAGMLSNTDGDTVLSFFQVFDDVGGTRSTFELDIVLACGGTPNCFQFAAIDTAFTLVGQHTCAPGALKCVSSGEQRPNGFGHIFLNTGVLNVTDPPLNTLAFNVNSTIEPGFTLYTGGTGGGTQVPEPSSLLLLAAGMMSIGGISSRRQRLLKK
jgi:hypothetical protein